jgi:hypothetical protein
MKRQKNYFRSSAFRLLIVGEILVRGIAEFLALQRSRYHAWRLRF